MKKVKDPIGYKRGKRYKILNGVQTKAEFNNLKSALYWLKVYKADYPNCVIAKILK